MTESATLPLRAAIAVVELGDATYAFDAGGVSVVRGGKVIGHADAPPRDGQPTTWQAAAAIAAPDGQGRWIVGIAGRAIWRITASGGLESVAERLGTANADVLAIDSSGTTSVIGLVGGAVVSNNGSHVMRFPGFDAPVVAAARDRVAIASKTSIDVFDLVKRSKISYPIANASYVGFLDATTDPTLVAAVDGTVYAEKLGKLAKLHAPATRRLAVSGSRLWFLGDSGLFAAERAGAIVAMTSPPAKAAELFGSRSGGVWVSSALDHVVRYTLDVPREDPAWHSTVKPVFLRACSGCHLAGGDADLDLSTPAAWAFRRAEIVQHVLVARTMPPAGTELTEPERQALEAWLRAAP